MKDAMEDGPSFPYILGSDGAGTVVATGEAVSRFKEGDRVFATGYLNPKGGFYAEYVAVKEDHTAPVPEGLGMEEAGALPVDGVTALRGLRELDLEEGETLLVFGAGGGVGHLAVQLAKRMGARVLAVASGGDGVDLVEKLDADEAVDGHGDELPDAIARLAPNGIDAALITANGEGLETALGGLREGARMVWPNGVQPEPEVPAGVDGKGYDGRPDRDILDELTRLMKSGPFMVHVDRTFSLKEATEAHRALDDHFLGKLAFRVEG